MEAENKNIVNEPQPHYEKGSYSKKVDFVVNCIRCSLKEIAV